MATRNSTSKAKAHDLEVVEGGDQPHEETAAEKAAREKRELDAAVVELKWLGETFAVPKRQGRWPVRAARAFEEGEYVKALVAFIGEDGWNRLETICPLVDDLNEFSDYAGKVIQRECVP